MAIDASTTVRLDDLREALRRVLDGLERRCGGEIDLGAEHYWQIELRAAFDLIDDPGAEIVSGQLSEDLAELAVLLARPDGEIVQWHDLEHLTAILRALAWRDVPGRGGGAEP
jgi:hypothetical protein